MGIDTSLGELGKQNQRVELAVECVKALEVNMVEQERLLEDSGNWKAGLFPSAGLGGY